MKPTRVIRLRYIRFSSFCPFVSGTGNEPARLPSPEAAFPGGPDGEPEPEGCESKAEASQTPGDAKPRSSAETNEQTGNATERITNLRPQPRGTP